MNATLVAVLKGVARAGLLFGILVPLVVVVVELPFLWGIMSAVVGGIVTAFVRERIFPQPGLATSLGEIAGFGIVLICAILAFSSDAITGEYNYQAETIGMIFLGTTIVTEHLLRKDESPDTPE